MGRYFFKHYKILCCYMFLTTLTVYANTKWAITTKDLVDAGVGKDINKFKSAIMLAIIFMGIFLLSEYFKKRSEITLFKRISISLKNEVFHKIINRNAEEFNKTRSGEYISILMNDVEEVKDVYIGSMIGLIHTSIQLCITVYAIVKLDLLIGALVVVTSIIPLITPKLTEKRLSETKSIQIEKLGAFTAKINDVFSGFSVIKSFNLQDRMNGEFKKINADTEDAIMKYQNVNAAASVIGGLSSYISILVCLIMGTYLTLKGNITIGVLMASMQLLDVISMGVLDFTYNIIDLKSVKNVKKQVMDILDEEIEKRVSDHKIEFKDKIEFKNVCFKYNESQEALKGINFTLKKGQKYTIVGNSGSGKSTLLKLILRFQTMYEGSIKIDGVEIKDLSLNDIHNMIGFIQQETYMFDTSIYDNICMYNDYSKMKVQEALKTSRLTDMVDKLTDGLDSMVGESGSNISGGERQRIAFARSIITDPTVLLLDEATSALDTETAKEIEDELLKNKELTAIVITHKLIPQQLKKYDKILVIKDGELIDIGTFEELMKKDGYFNNLIFMATKNQKEPL